MIWNHYYRDSKPDSTQGKNPLPQPLGWTLFEREPPFPHPSSRLHHPFLSAVSILPPAMLCPLLLGLWVLPLHPPPNLPIVWQKSTSFSIHKLPHLLPSVGITAPHQRRQGGSVIAVTFAYSIPALIFLFSCGIGLPSPSPC